MSTARLSHRLLLLMLLSSAQPLAAQATGQDAPAPARKPGTVVLRGCVAGGALTMTTTEDDEAADGVVAGASYRIAGRKAIVKQLKNEQNGRWVEVTGKVKGQFAPKGSGQRRSIGGVSVGIGLPNGDPNAPRVPEMPAFEVESFRSLDINCDER